MYDIQKKSSTGKNVRVFSPRCMQEKVNEMASKVKILNTFVFDLNWKWLHDDVILNHKNDSQDATPNFYQHWSY